MKRFIEVLYADVEATRAHFSENWKEHANRRTTIILAVLIVLGSVLYFECIQPPNDFPIDKLVTISEGMPLQTAAATLESEGVVRSALALRLIVTFMGGDRSVHAGDYLFREPQHVFAIARALVQGAFGLEPIRIRVPEGATVQQMARYFSPQLQRFNRAMFIEKATSLEGYLFPDTYFFLPNATEDTVIQTMRNNFDLQTQTLAPLIASSTRSFSDVVVMASLLEREARNFKDRQMIAGVLWRRIDKGMALQVDAAFLYIIGRTTFDLTKKDLQMDSPYNTYRYKGLPPGAIGSPSLDAIRAALTPIDKGYLYYLADYSGVTHYSKTYQEHLQKKALYLGT